MKLLVIFAMTGMAFAADPPQLTDAQKYQAVQFQLENMQLQSNARDLQARVQAFSDQACGKENSLVFIPDGKGQITPACHSNKPPEAAAPVKAPDPPKKP